MKQFDELLAVAERLNGPGGCPWDREQNFYSIQPYLLEELHELNEAIDLQDDTKIIEELGDLFYSILFYGKLGEKEGRFSIIEVIDGIKEKLIRRHPHVFGELKVEDSGEVLKNWEAIKSKEASHADRKSILDGVPPTLPVLPTAQKMIRKIKKTPFSLTFNEKSLSDKSEEAFGEALLRLVLQAEEANINIESALRRTLYAHQMRFRAWEMAEEKNTGDDSKA